MMCISHVLTVLTHKCFDRVLAVIKRKVPCVDCYQAESAVC